MSNHWTEDACLHLTASIPDRSISQHARQRFRQRAIPPFVVDLLDDYGSCVRVDSASRLFFDKKARARLKRVFSESTLKTLDRWFNVYAVVSDDGTVVTVGHRHSRVLRDCRRYRR